MSFIYRNGANHPVPTELEARIIESYQDGVFKPDDDLRGKIIGITRSVFGEGYIFVSGIGMIDKSAHLTNEVKHDR